MRECEHGRVCNAYGDGLGCPAECGYYEPRIDRGALLKVADMLECDGECSECECGKGIFCEAPTIAAARIREALEVEL